MSHNKNTVVVIRQKEIEQATAQEYRQYFCGNLKRPQILDYIQTESLEIGTSNYKKFTADEPHYHTQTPDLIYILSGEYHILIIPTMEEYVLKKGDFINIPVNTGYASKATPNTQTLFIKQTKSNDKVTFDITDEVKEWLETVV